MVTRMPLLAKLSCAAAIVFSGCASTNSYVQPATTDAAWVSGKSVHTAFADWESLLVTTVDNKFVPVSFFSQSAKARLALTPETHRLVVHATFNRQLAGPGPFEAFVVLSFEPQPGGNYQLGGGVRDNVVDAWMEDRSTGERVSEIVSAPYQTQPQTTTYTPVYYVPPISPPVSSVTVHVK